MKACTIYKTQNKLLVVCMHETDAKFYKLAEPIRMLESLENPTEVGGAVLEILSHSKHGLPVHSTGLGIVPILLKFAGLKSWRKFEAELTECFAEFDGSMVHVTPCLKTGGSSRPHLPDKRVVCTATPKDLGDTVVRLLTVTE